MKKLCYLSEIAKAEIFISPFFIFKKCSKKNLNACDIIIRIMAIKNFYKKNNYGFKIYDEIQKYRVSTKKVIPKEQYDNIENFKSLIKSIEERGFDKDKPIVLNKHFMVIDGAHRLAIALYNKIEKIPVVFTSKAYNIDYDYSIKWLIKNGFERYAKLIFDEYQQIMSIYEK